MDRLPPLTHVLGRLLFYSQGGRILEASGVLMSSEADLSDLAALYRSNFSAAYDEPRRQQVGRLRRLRRLEGWGGTGDAGR